MGWVASRLSISYGVDILTPTDNHVLDAVNNEYVAVIVHHANVTGMQVSVDDGVRPSLQDG